MAFSFVFLIRQKTTIQLTYFDTRPLTNYIDLCVETTARNAVNEEGLDEEKIENYVSNNLNKCIKWDLFREQGIEIEKEPVKTRAILNEELMLLSIEFPITLRKGQIEKTIQDFTTKQKLLDTKPLEYNRDLETSEPQELLLLDGSVSIEMTPGTMALIDEGTPINYFLVNLINNPDSGDLSSVMYDLQPSGAIFNPPLKVIIKYDEEQVRGINEYAIRLFWYDEEEGEWKPYPGIVDPEHNTLTSFVSHFTLGKLGLHEGAPRESLLEEKPPLEEEGTEGESQGRRFYVAKFGDTMWWIYDDYVYTKYGDNYLRQDFYDWQDPQLVNRPGFPDLIYPGEKIWLDPMFEEAEPEPAPEPTCSDNIQNQGETGVDCGGPCSPCPTCFDRIQNQGEKGIDCDGPCPPCIQCPNDGDNLDNPQRLDIGEEVTDCVGDQDFVGDFYSVDIPEAKVEASSDNEDVEVQTWSHEEGSTEIAVTPEATPPEEYTLTVTQKETGEFEVDIGDTIIALNPNFGQNGFLPATKGSYCGPDDPFSKDSKYYEDYKDHCEAGNTPKFLILHYTVGPGGSAVNTFSGTNPRKVSAHYVMHKDGSVTQMVKERNCAITSGCISKDDEECTNKGLLEYPTNCRLIQIEIANWGYLIQRGERTGNCPQDATCQSDYCDAYCRPIEKVPGFCHDPGCGPYDKCIDTDCNGDPETWVYDMGEGNEFHGHRYWHKYSDAQKNAIRRLSADIIRRNPSIIAIIGHQHVYLGKTDPGPALDSTINLANIRSYVQNNVDSWTQDSAYNDLSTE